MWKVRNTGRKYLELLMCPPQIPVAMRCDYIRADLDRITDQTSQPGYGLNLLLNSGFLPCTAGDMYYLETLVCEYSHKRVEHNIHGNKECYNTCVNTEYYNISVNTECYNMCQYRMLQYTCQYRMLQYKCQYRILQYKCQYRMLQYKCQ